MALPDETVDLLEIPLPEKIENIINEAAERDPQKAKVLCKYYWDMKKALSEMQRVLRLGKGAVIVVTNECPIYKAAALRSRTQLDFYVVTNEYDPARLRRKSS